MPTKNLPEDIERDFTAAAALHQRAVADYTKCLEFNKTLARLLDKLEDCDQLKLANKVMGILIDCSPKEGGHCDQATQIDNKINSLTKTWRKEKNKETGSIIRPL